MRQRLAKGEKVQHDNNGGQVTINVCMTCRKWARCKDETRVVGVCNERLEGNEVAVPKVLKLSEVFTYGDIPARCKLFDERWIED